ncbi:MAG TPA: class II aldolase/adducin family protein [Phycisphaerae bacterium]|nr:class II aldolase/adducin family protein [Phycisphaerae bacterium]
MMGRSLIHPRVEITETLDRIYAYRMTTTSGGNISVRDENGDVWITPARVDKGTLRAADIVCVKADGTVEGAHRPSSEYPFHRAIYRARPDLCAIVHAHPVALVAFSITDRVPDVSMIPQAAHVCGAGKMGFAAYELPGSEALGERIAETFASGPVCVILQNHGAVVGGGNLQEAFERFETLEFAAKTEIKARMLGTPRFLDAGQLALAEKPRGILPEFDPPAASTGEKMLRQQLADFMRRGYRQRLLTSTGGSFSARVEGGTFLISCTGVDRRGTRIEDLALVRGGKVEGGKRPSRAVLLHAAIYEKHPEVQAIANALSVNATAFSVTGTTLDARTIPESYIFLRDVGVIPYAEQFGDGRAVAGRISMRQPAMLMENNGCLVVGTSVLDAFDRLEVLESTAEAIINARQIGPLAVMGEDRLAELKRAFKLS